MTSTKLGILIGAGLTVLVIAGSIWLHLNYRCVRWHEEWRTECYQTGSTESCRTYPVQVCDQYEPR